MVFSTYIQDQLRLKCGTGLRGAQFATQLALDIESVTGEHIGVNTVKRLLGMIDDEREPRLSTLDIVACYLGYADWEELRLYDKDSNSAFNDSDGSLLRSEDLPVGARLSVAYPPDRDLTLRHLGQGRFTVERSERSKLHAGDEICVTHFVKAYPLIASEVIRDGQSLGGFTAGKERGISFRLL